MEQNKERTDYAKISKPQFVSSGDFMAQPEYVSWLAVLKTHIRQSQSKVALRLNESLVTLYWSMGEDICRQEKQYKWGSQFMQRLSLDLRAGFPNTEGFSCSNLYFIRRWYRFYSGQSDFLYQAGTKMVEVENATLPMPDMLTHIPWRHHISIISKCDSVAEALFYVGMTIERNMSRTELETVISEQLYHTQGRALTNFDKTLPVPQDQLAQAIMKDPYKLDFVRLQGRYTEKDLEDKLSQNITRFLLELGKGFAYVGRQVELQTASGKSYFPDMLFYHIRLKCYVVVELKAVDFKPEFVGKLNFYVAAADELLRGEGDNPSIGLLLCKDKDDSVVEWSLKGVTTPLGVASYQLQEVYKRTMLELQNEVTIE